MKILAVTACPTGIAHTYMAAEALQKAADKLGLKIKVETQGAMGLENILTARDIACADLVLIASDIEIEIEQKDRFLGCQVRQVSLESVLLDASAVLKTATVGV
ncbi:PTS fructose transporter subunit IIB [Aeromonas piscicola]|uniref:PTS fructose transporter subunit IIB n=1 Tax=Aeromonas piscicola TaxID=600645 RepID=UPI0005B369B9|nr:PTS fructose transporter subunit IIB [Aeromonas piscicola]